MIRKTIFGIACITWLCSAGCLDSAGWAQYFTCLAATAVIFAILGDMKQKGELE